MRATGLSALVAGVALAAAGPPAAAAWSVSTFHYDISRTGWDSQETALTPTSVASPSPQFGLLAQVLLPDNAQIDAQPLFVPGVTIGGQTYNVVYVATEDDDVYAIDAATGNILLSQGLGSPVPLSQLPGDCNNNGSVGINSTPVIDLSTATMYVMAFTDVNGSTPTWMLHALDLATLQDEPYSPVVVQASSTLANHSTYSFNAAVSRQRAALLEANGNIYAGFASFCDMNGGALRGFVLGWQAGSLAPLATNRLNDRRVHAAQGMFFSDVWMSGDGIAANAAGSLYFVTGNSDPSGTSYGSTINPSESVLKVRSDLSRMQDYFTPSDANYGVAVLDQSDADFGSGGITLLPKQPGSSTLLAVAAGKAGLMYLLDRNHLGHYSSNGVNQVLGTYAIGPCWCSEAYFTGADGVGRVVSSGGVLPIGPPLSGGGGGGQIMVWTVQTSPPGLTLESQSQALPQSGQDGGFFTSVSSNGRQNPIIWAVGRPTGVNDDSVTLYAYDPVAAAGSYGTANWLFEGTAGSWPNIGGNANIVPVVADGQVFVASYGELDIFGLGANSAAARRLAAHLTHPKPPPRWPLPAGSHEVYGKIKALGAGQMTLVTRTGTSVPVAVIGAIDADHSVELRPGATVRVIGRYERAHVLEAQSIIKAKPSPLAWPADR